MCNNTGNVFENVQMSQKKSSFLTINLALGVKRKRANHSTNKTIGKSYTVSHLYFL